MIKGKKRRILASVSLHHACNDASTVVLPSIFPLLYTQKLLIRNYSAIGNTILVGLVTAVGYQTRYRKSAQKVKRLLAKVAQPTNSICEAWDAKYFLPAMWL